MSGRPDGYHETGMIEAVLKRDRLVLIAALVVLTALFVLGEKVVARGDLIGRSVGAGLARWRALAPGSG